MKSMLIKLKFSFNECLEEGSASHTNTCSAWHLDDSKVLKYFKSTFSFLPGLYSTPGTDTNSELSSFVLRPLDFQQNSFWRTKDRTKDWTKDRTKDKLEGELQFGI